MYLHTDEEISSLRRHELLHMYKEQNLQLQLPADLSVESLRANLKSSERTRTIGIWHDHAAILGRGYILVTAKVSMIKPISGPILKLTIHTNFKTSRLTLKNLKSIF